MKGPPLKSQSDHGKEELLEIFAKENMPYKFTYPQNLQLPQGDIIALQLGGHIDFA